MKEWLKRNSHLAIAAGAFVVCALAIPYLLNINPSVLMNYRNFGFPIPAGPLPKAVLSNEGKIDGRSWEKWMHEALTSTVGEIDDERSHPISPWIDKEPGGRKIHGQGGQLRTKAVRTPAPILAAIGKNGTPPQELEKLAYRVVVLRYWVERAEGNSEETGLIYYRFEVSCGPDPDAPPRKIKESSLALALVDDLLARLANGR